MCECEKDRERGDERTRERVGEREKERDFFFLNNAFNTVPTDVNLACSFDTDSGENSQVVFWLVMTVLFFSRWFSLFFKKNRFTVCCSGLHIQRTHRIHRNFNLSSCDKYC